MSIYSLAACGDSARRTIRGGQRFEYEDDGDARVGYYNRSSNKLTVLSPDEARIINHFSPDRGVHYVRSLDRSTYRG